MNKIEYLILSSSIDFSSDLICLELEKRGLQYLRVNRDYFTEYKVVYDLNKESLTIKIKENLYYICNDSLKAILFRAPVFIRAYGKNYDLDKQLVLSQWNAFIRNLVVFDKAKWINHPVSTYQAENKLLQLKYAKENGILIPETYVANNLPEKFTKDYYIVKALDTPLFYDSDDELFTYTMILSQREVKKASLSLAPVFIQECISPKIDLRVTAVGDKLFSTQILQDGLGIEGDWRKTKKENLQYLPFNLPTGIEQKLRILMKKLNLQFGGIDLILSQGKFYFIEINPTGEWSWLIKPTGYKIDAEIVNCMENNCNENSR